MIQNEKKNARRIMVNSDIITEDHEDYKSFLQIEHTLDEHTKHVLEKTATQFFKL